MIERKFISQNMKEFKIKEYVANSLNRVGLSDVKLQRTPLGEKIIVSASRPGLVVGRGGSNIQKLTRDLKEHFSLENPQIEIEEIKELWMDPGIVAEYIAGTLERFGTRQFKGVGYRSLAHVMEAGALGVEILISGKIPSQRSKTWRFYQGYLKKCGDIAVTGVDVAYTTAHLKAGSVGVKVSIMPAKTKLPDRIDILEEKQQVVEEVTGEEAEVVSEEISQQAAGKKQSSADNDDQNTVEDDKTKKKPAAKTPKKKPAKKAPANPDKKNTKDAQKDEKGESA